MLGAEKAENGWRELLGAWLITRHGRLLAMIKTHLVEASAKPQLTSVREWRCRPRTTHHWVLQTLGVRQEALFLPIPPEGNETLTPWFQPSQEICVAVKHPHSISQYNECKRDCTFSLCTGREDITHFTPFFIKIFMNQKVKAFPKTDKYSLRNNLCTTSYSSVKEKLNADIGWMETFN